MLAPLLVPIFSQHLLVAFGMFSLLHVRLGRRFLRGKDMGVYHTIFCCFIILTLEISLIDTLSIEIFGGLFILNLQANEASKPS
jgi:hypothetical protein